MEFVAQLDLLEVLECDFPDPNGEGNSDDGFCKIVFLVRSDQELREIFFPASHNNSNQTKSSTIFLDFDRERTEALKDYESRQMDADINAVDTGASFSTIRGFSCYADLGGSKEIMNNLVQQAESIPNLKVVLKDVGDSYLKSKNITEGHDILALEITGSGASVAGHTAKKGVVLVVAGIHPREYAPPELLARWAQGLVDGYGTDPDITSVLDHTSIHLVFQTNPDGRYLAETSQSFRRKNLNDSAGSSNVCADDSTGVDLNRNFPFRWGLNSGSSSSPCSETYRGSSPASEPETRAIVNYARSLFPENQRKEDPEGPDLNEPYPEGAMGIFLDIHSYGEMIIWPWGNENRETANNNGLEALVNKYRHFSGYAFSGPGNGYLYPASGASDDWAYGTLGAAGMTFEIGNNFHQDCYYFENYVLPDNLPALTYAAKVAAAPYSISKGPDIIDFSISPTLVVANQERVSITLRARASDGAYSSANFGTSRQAIAGIRVSLDIHPYDHVHINGNGPSYLQLQGDYGSENTVTGELQVWLDEITTVDGMSALATVGRHMIYVQAVDSAGYYGPVAATWFDVAAPPAPPRPPEEDDGPENDCGDSVDLFVFLDRKGNNSVNESCEWLSVNQVRYGWLCERLGVANKCPSTCGACDIFRSPA